MCVVVCECMCGVRGGGERGRGVIEGVREG